MEMKVENAVKEMKFVTACRDFFGHLPGQGLGQFAEEVKKLTPADRQEIKDGLEKNGYKILDFTA